MPSEGGAVAAPRNTLWTASWAVSDETNMPEVLYDGPVLSRQEAIKTGQTRYFTGKVCPKGHVDQRGTANKACISCLNAANRVWTKKNPEKARAKHNRWANANPEKKKESQRKSAARCKDKISARLRKRYAEDPSYYKARASAWQKANPKKQAAIMRTRRAKVAGTGGRHSTKDIESLLKMQKGRCANPSCKKDIKRGGYHIDHIIPVSKGGSNSARNLQLLCPVCNHRKHAKHPIDFMREQGFLL
jgi:5-methylcytosine-specific restriction endonuclease McrA